MMANAKQNISLTSRASWLIVAKTAAFVFGFALPLLLVRRLTQNDFGLYKQAFLVIGTVSGILPLGFATSAFYFLPREREKSGAIVLNINLFNCIVGGLAVILFFNRTPLAGADSEQSVARALRRIHRAANSAAYPRKLFGSGLDRS
jgi:O-antigen/teichoic acid export membrane protein